MRVMVRRRVTVVVPQGATRYRRPADRIFRHVTLMEPSLVADVGPMVRWAARGRGPVARSRSQKRQRSRVD